MDESQ